MHNYTYNYVTILAIQFNKLLNKAQNKAGVTNDIDCPPPEKKKKK